MSTPDSPSDEVFRTPNTTLDVEDSALETFSTPIGDFSMMKMKSMNNLLDEVETIYKGNLSRMKSLSEIDKENGGDTPIGLIRMKKDFENKRFNNAKMQSLSNLTNGDDYVDGMITKRHHSDNSPSPDLNRLSLQTPKIFKRVGNIGNTKYVGADSVEEKNYQLMKMRSMGTINDHMSTKNHNGFDPFRNANKVGVGRKYDKTLIVPIRLDDRLGEMNGNCDKNDDVFKVPENPMLALRKEKSSSCIESMRSRGTMIYDRLR